MQRIGSEGSHGSNLVWRPLKAVGATLRALPFKHRVFCCRENNPQHRYNIKVAKHNTERLNFKSGYLHLEVNECQQWRSMFMLRLCVLVRVCVCARVVLKRFLHFREVVLRHSRSNQLHILSRLTHRSLFPNQLECRDFFSFFFFFFVNKDKRTVLPGAALMRVSLRWQVAHEVNLEREPPSPECTT